MNLSGKQKAVLSGFRGAHLNSCHHHKAFGGHGYDEIAVYALLIVFSPNS